MSKSLPILIALFLAASLAVTGFALATHSFFGLTYSFSNPTFRFQFNPTHQGITGNVTIANVSPLCSLSGSQPSSGPRLIVTSATGKNSVISLNWSIVDQCALVSHFQILLQPSTYTVTLGPCIYLRCNNLPATVTVQPGAFSPIEIDINTGIY